MNFDSKPQAGLLFFYNMTNFDSIFLYVGGILILYEVALLLIGVYL